MAPEKLLDSTLGVVFAEEKLFDWREDFKNPHMPKDSWIEDIALKLGDCIAAVIYCIKKNYF